jgi:DNA-binding transcriptional LysR family regulator
MINPVDLTPRLLEQFIVLAEEKHYGRAAERLMMSQPPLSQAIQRLERIVGTRLLHRGSHGVALTPAGEAFAADAQRIIDAQHAALARARRIAAGEEGEIRVGFVSGLAHWHMPRLLASVARELPGLRAHLRATASDALIDAVRLGALDLAFIRTFEPQSTDLTVRGLGHERTAVALPEAHPLSGAETISLAELAQDRFVVPGEHTMPEHLQDLMTACRDAGYLPRIHAHADNLAGLLSYVASGLCIALVPESVVGLSLPGVLVRPLVAPVITNSISAVHRPAPDPAVEALLTHTGVWFAEAS